jgi:hypothetical protein
MGIGHSYAKAGTKTRVRRRDAERTVGTRPCGRGGKSADTLGNPGSACPMPAPTNLNCDKDFTAQLQVMCNTKAEHVSVGVIAPDTSAFASQAFQSVADYGFTGVALWPGNMGFLAQDNFPQGQTWYPVFSDFLAQK